MPRVLALLVASLSLLIIAGCGPLAEITADVPPAEDELAKRCVALLAAKDFAAVEALMTPEIVSAEFRTSLVELAAFLPEDAPRAIQLDYYGIFNTDGVPRVDIFYLYQFDNSWMLIEVVLEKRGDALLVAGIQLDNTVRAWTEANKFTFAGKSLQHFAIFAITIFNPIFIVFALILCIRTPMPRRKLLWIIFILVGITQIQLDWTSGDVSFDLVAASLLAAGFWKASAASPLILSVGIPLGAIIFLLKRKKWLQPPPADAAIPG
jgi:hypothetical protein